MDLTLRVYRLTKDFPVDERFGLISQIRRSAVSVPSNIAEGHGRESSGELLRFLNIARGSLAETQTQLLLAKRLEFGDSNEVEQAIEACDEVGRMLRGLQKSITSAPQPLDSKL